MAALDISKHLIKVEDYDTDKLAFVRPRCPPKTDCQISLYYASDNEDYDMYGLLDYRKVIMCTPRMEMTLLRDTGDKNKRNETTCQLSLVPNHELHNELSLKRWVRMVETTDGSIMNHILENLVNWKLPGDVSYIQSLTRVDEIPTWMNVTVSSSSEEYLGVFDSDGTKLTLDDLAEPCVIQAIMELSMVTYHHRSKMFKVTWKPLQIKKIPRISPLYLQLANTLVISPPPGLPTRPPPSSTRPPAPRVPTAPPLPPLKLKPPPERVDPSPIPISQKFTVTDEQLHDMIGRLRSTRTDGRDPADKPKKKKKRARPKVI